MSYDFCWYKDPSFKEAVTESRNYTSNISEMLYDGLGEINMDILKTGVHCIMARGMFIQFLDNALRNSDRYRGMEPYNGWGDYEGFLHVILDIIFICEEHPQSFFRLEA